MGKRWPVLLVSVCIFHAVYAQTPVITGKPIAEIFTDFHLNFNDTLKHTGFDINRAYFGYQFLPTGNLSAKIILNVGSPDDLAEGAKSRRYIFLREASISWAKDNLTVSMGITATKIFEFQQKFWGKRYIASTYQSINGYGFVADLGISADYKFNDIIEADMTLMNGEGYSDLQSDNNLRTSLGLTITPTENLAIRLYGDIQKQQGLWQPVAISFLGFKNKVFMIGIEASYKSNIDLVEGHHAWGLSSTGGINITEKTQIFYRFDYSSSVTVPGGILPWNYTKDGKFLITGIQYSFTSDIKLALDYQGTYPYAPSSMATDMIFVNALFRF
jgi:hypothetical protein